MLLNHKDVLEILQCPQTGSKLQKIDNKLITTADEEVREYKIINDYPVLIDFNQSILSKENVQTLNSVIDRSSYQGLSRIIKQLISPPQKTTANNVRQLKNLLFESNTKSRVLVVGGGAIGQGMEPIYEDPRIELVSFDIYASPHVQFLADAHNIPLADNSFDAVIIQAVLEHVLEPIKVVAEIHRVLKPQGIVYAETPFLQHVHEGAYDFIRFTESGHRYLFKNFELIESGASAGAGTQLLWSIDNFFRGLFKSKNLGKVVKLLFFWLQYCDRLIPDEYNIDAASGVFFLGRKQSAQIDRVEMVVHYKGAQV